uniref:Uncharacterized protein n=1 Tax=Anguilla anguilla TaxID=7936 RepID=A0A0E9VQE6_ANGAN
MVLLHVLILKVFKERYFIYFLRYFTLANNLNNVRVSCHSYSRMKVHCVYGQHVSEPLRQGIFERM